jgi:hypothetical protein
MKDYREDPFFALIFYAVIMKELGYEVFWNVHKAYNNITLLVGAMKPSLI